MIGLGRWKCSVKHFLYDGNVYMEFFKAGDSYDVTFSLDNGIPFPSYKIIKMQEHENRIKITAKVTNILGEVIINLIFNGDTFKGEVLIPILGSIKVVNGVRLEEAFINK